MCYTNDELDKIMSIFNKFKYEHEEINFMSKYDDDYDWYNKDALFVIFAEYEPTEKNARIHIHYDYKFWGSKLFNKWLKKYKLHFEWYDTCVGIVSRKIT